MAIKFEIKNIVNAFNHASGFESVIFDTQKDMASFATIIRATEKNSGMVSKLFINERYTYEHMPKESVVIDSCRGLLENLFKNKQARPHMIHKMFDKCKCVHPSAMSMSTYPVPLSKEYAGFKWEGVVYGPYDSDATAMAAFLLLMETI